MTDADVPLLVRREIEAKVVAPLLRAFAAEVGEERAREIVSGVVRELARQSGRDAAGRAGGCGVGELRQAVEGWRQGGALELTVLRSDGEALEFDVTRCRYAEMYQRLGVPELGALLSCDRDGAMVEGFSPDIELERTQTVLGGAPCCDFRFRRRGG